MRKGQVEVTQVARLDRSHLEFRAARLNETGMVYIPADMEDGIRMHLVDAHKARKAAKKEERRFYASPVLGTIKWDVHDSDFDGAIIATFFDVGAEANARAYAKLRNKRNRKLMGANDGD